MCPVINTFLRRCLVIREVLDHVCCQGSSYFVLLLDECPISSSLHKVLPRLSVKYTTHAGECILITDSSSPQMP